MGLGCIIVIIIVKWVTAFYSYRYVLMYNQSLQSTSIMQAFRLRSEIPVPQYNFKLEHHHKIVTLGSCFASNIAERLQDFRFTVMDNPFGVLYNPISILQSVKSIQSEKLYSKEDLIYHDEEWHSFDHHSDFSRCNAEECLKIINDNLEKTRAFFSLADILIITYGTAYVYKHLKRDRIVSNCHRIPAQEFKYFLLNLQETIEATQKIVDTARAINPAIRIIFSISPIRYLKEGFTENQLSKALLFLALHKAIADKEDCVYFPAYEIMMDDLRDYRFYKANLTHPNALAIDYIWRIFSQSFFSRECFMIMEKVEKVVQAYRHRPRNPQTNKHKQFILKQLNYAAELKNQYTYLNIEKEMNYFKEILSVVEKGNFKL